MTSATSANDRRAIVAADHRFSIDGKTRALYGGAMHYWRLRREQWSPIVDEVKRLGFTMISIYIPWEVHERSRGDFDFDGQKDIDAFLTLLEEKGLDVVVRPGPQINSELTWFGYPLRILADPELQARNGQGTPAVLTQVPRPIPAVSYAVDRFYEETAVWYDAVCPILARHAYPNGGIVAAQVDNEMAYFFHVNAYAADYNPASIERYRAFLAGRYETIESLNDTYGSSYRGFEEIDPPRRFEAKTRQTIPSHTDWVAYRERYLVDAMGRLGEMMRDRGLGGIPLFHNYPHPLGPGGAASGFTTPFDLSGLEERLDFVGFDVYSRKELYDHVKTVLSYVVGTSRYPYIPEFIAGVWPWYLDPGDIRDEEFVTKAALMQGVKGFSRYMLVERDRWLDSPIRADGRVREDHATMFGRANDVALEGGFAELRRRADVLLLANRDYDRLEAAAVLVSFPGDFLETPSSFSEYPTFMTVSEDTLGFSQAIQMAKSEWFARAGSGLSESGFAFLLSDTALPADRWRSFKVVVVSSYEFMSAEVQHKLVEFAEEGGTVVLGPELPHLDERMQPCEVIREAVAASATEALGDVGAAASCGRGRIVHVTDFGRPSEVFDTALGELGLLRFRRNDARLDVAVHASAEGDDDRLVVYVANPTADSIAAQVALSEDVTFVRELWEDRHVGMRTTLTEELPPYTIRIYECRRRR